VHHRNPVFTVVGFTAYLVLLLIAVIFLPQPQHTREAALDETLDESFPASDPPSHTPMTGATVVTA